MFRKSALAMAIWGAMATQSAFGLGLGEITLKSALNQPLKAEVEVLSASDKELQELKVVLAPHAKFDAAGIDRPNFLTKFKFIPERKADGTAVISITSRDSIREPFLDFILEIVWANGKMLREYTVLVDPPVTMPAPTPVTQAPLTRAPAAKAAPAPAPAPSSAPVPAADVGSWSGDTYGPTGRNDTLWEIAQKVRPDNGVSMEQTMLGLLNANPEAFYKHNINNLKAGYVLRVPDRAELTSISQADARAEARLQHQEWREGRQRSSREATRPPVAAPAPVTAAPEAKLELVAPDATADTAGAGASEGEAAGLGTLRKELVLATEAAEVQRRQSAEMESRLQALEDQIAKMQRLIELKDDQLALLKQQTGEDGMPAAAEEAGAEAMDAADALESELFVDTGEDAGAADAEMPGDMGDEAMAEAPAGAEPAAEEAVTEAPPPPALTEEIITEPEPFEADQSLLDRVMANPLWLGGGAVALALLAWLGIRRRSGSEPEFQESILQEREPRPTRASAPVVETPEPEVEPEVVPEAGSESDSSLLSEFATSDLGAIQNQSEADPMAEADVYLAYGRYQQAEDLIKTALEQEPDRDDLNLKLFEIYSAARNRNDFDAHAQQVLARLESQDHPLWQQVAAMGQEISPDNPLYRGEAPAATGAPAAQDLDAELDSGLSDFMAEEPKDLDAGLDTPAPVAEESNDLDFDLGELDLDEDLGAEPVAAEPAGEVEEDLGDGLLSDVDEVATKLDLARAYIDMGDPEGARSILEEVMDEGNDSQKGEAQELIAQL